MQCRSGRRGRRGRSGRRQRNGQGQRDDLRATQNKVGKVGADGPDGFHLSSVRLQDRGILNEGRGRYGIAIVPIKLKAVIQHRFAPPEALATVRRAGAVEFTRLTHDGLSPESMTRKIQRHNESSIAHGRFFTPPVLVHRSTMSCHVISSFRTCAQPFPLLYNSQCSAQAHRAKDLSLITSFSSLPPSS